MTREPRFHDCNVLVGPWVRPFPHRDDTVSGLVRQMERVGIESAWVTHRYSLEYDPMAGNERLLQEIASHPQLKPVWVLVPSGSGEMPSPASMMGILAERGVRMVRMFPGKHKFAFTEWNLGDWLDPLADRRVPLILDCQDYADYDALYRVFEPRPDLPVILTNVYYREDRNLFHFLERLPNVRVDSSTYKPHLGLERMVARFGAGRLLFGSSMTEINPGPAMAGLLRAGISASAKREIAGENLQSLLREVRL